jgi:hypothetical protein
MNGISGHMKDYPDSVAKKIIRVFIHVKKYNSSGSLEKESKTGYN